jgi:Fur family peroxide stress response transcriptional regulator
MMDNKTNIAVAELMQKFEQDCKARGLRLTHQRLEIFKEMAKYPDHPSAEDIYANVRRRLKTISLDTVYRTIATFEENGLVRRVQVLDNKARFDTNTTAHHHLVCTACQSIEDFYWQDFDKIKLPQTITEWGIIDSKHVELRGLCRKCKRKLNRA